MSDFTFGALSRAPRPALGRTIADAVLILHEMVRARTTRRLLTDLDDRLLADIGVGRGDAIEEARRPMWDLAPGRR
ncbi:MAG: DUF1127 domain-containing protein [Acetobacteraceae bacterium]|nr:DUF1127 domain-containing protein [Acetobacteraceae bacterium]